MLIPQLDIQRDEQQAVITMKGLTPVPFTFKREGTSDNFTATIDPGYVNSLCMGLAMLGFSPVATGNEVTVTLPETKQDEPKRAELKPDKPVTKWFWQKWFRS